jgi:drug/metabolite transporter (DMT)-like permease
MTRETEKATRNLADSPIVVVTAFLIALVSGAALNILAGQKVNGVSPIVVNGTRTLLAAGMLGVLAAILGIRLHVRRSVFWRYFLIAMLTMAVPHSLIFVGRQLFGVSATALSLIEAAIVGVVVVYLLAEGKRISKMSVALAVMTIVGLTVFVNPTGLKAGDGIILIAAVVTAFGLILAERIKPPAPTVESVSATPYLPHLETAMRKTTLSAASSGGVILLVVALVNLIGIALSKPTIPVAASPLLANWGLILGLAVAGSILTWFSLFLLIDLGHLFLAAAAIAAIPVATEIYNVIRGASEINSTQQWLGGLVVMVSLGGLIWNQLGRNTMAAQTPDEPHVANDEPVEMGPVTEAV